MPIPDEGRNKVFVSYSHKDLRWLKRVQTHLKDLTRRGLVELWDDTKIQSGSQWREEIRDALESAKVAVLLVSADFIASDFIAEDELPPLLAAAEKGGAVILPLILSPSRFEKIESLARFQSVNPLSQPLTKLRRAEQDEYLVKLSDDVLHAVEGTSTTPIREDGIERRVILNLPFPRNKFFTGRDDILEGLHTGFSSGESVLALNGMGGIGKTQTALEYAYRYQQDYDVVLWAGAQTREALVADLAAIAGILNLHEKDAQDQSETVSAVKRWFDGIGGWLLILDNADDLAMVRAFIPSKETGHVLLTTRAQNTRPIAVRQAVEKMEPQEGALFLLRRLEKIKKNEPLESAPEGLRSQAEALSKEVDGLPLALDQAAAFIEETPSTLEEYQTLYQSERKELLKRRGRLSENHPSVTVTFSLAYNKVADGNPAAADLLRVCSFLEADSIPEEIFSEGATELGEALASIAESPLGLSDAIEEAGRFSLLRRHPDAKTVGLHRLVQAVLRDEMGSDTQRMWAERAVRAVNSVFPEVEYSNWRACNRLVPHAQSLAQVINEFNIGFLEAARMMNQTGGYLNERARYAEAEPLLRRALAIYENVRGVEHQDVANTLNNLAGLCYNWGKYVEAGLLWKRALAIFEKALGVEDLKVASTLNNMAVYYDRQGNYAEAEPLLWRALAIYEKVRGTEHQDVANALNNLAGVYYNQGKYAETESLWGRTLDIREKTLVAEHPSIATSLNNLAALCDKQGKYVEAEPLLRRALAIYEKAYGAEHPNVANSLNNLADVNRKLGKYDEAEPLLKRALAIFEEALDTEHLYFAEGLNNLALLYDNQGKYAEAEPLYQRALAVYEKVLGEEHPDVATVLENYAVLLRATGKESDAEKLKARASAIRKT